jgi:hypothetical protein
MNVINIRQEYARLNFTINDGQLQLSGAGEQVRVEGYTQAARLDITRSDGQLQIDNYPSRAARGLKKMDDFTRDNAQAGMQALKAFASKLVQHGVAVLNGKGKKLIPQMAYSNSGIGRPAPYLAINHVQMPSMSYTPGQLDFSYTPSKPVMEFPRTQIENTTPATSIDYSVSPEASIRMWVSEGKYDIYA